MRYTDWGERAARWSGIRSETVDVHGTKVHYLVTDQTRPSEVPVHLLVPGAAGGASNWLDVLAELRPHAHAIAVDLPGTMAGHTALPNRRAAGIETNALFLRDFTDALELDHVVVHGWSAGGMIALLFADQAPERVDGLVLVAPALAPALSVREARMWQTLGRAGLAVVAPVARVLLRVSGRRILAASQRQLADPTSMAGSKWNTGGDLTRMSPEIAGLMREEMSAVEPTRMGSAVTVYASLMSLMLLRRQPVLDAMRRVAAPTLLVWGDEDRLTLRASIDDWTAQRPDWNLVALPRVGHAPPFEVPADYAHTVIDWSSAAARCAVSGVVPSDRRYGVVLPDCRGRADGRERDGAGRRVAGAGGEHGGFPVSPRSPGASSIAAPPHRRHRLPSSADHRPGTVPPGRAEQEQPGAHRLGGLGEEHHVAGGEEHRDQHVVDDRGALVPVVDYDLLTAQPAGAAAARGSAGSAAITGRLPGHHRGMHENVVRLVVRFGAGVVGGLGRVRRPGDRAAGVR